MSPWALAPFCLVVTTAGFGTFLALTVPDLDAPAALAGGLILGVPATLLTTFGLTDRRFRRRWSRAERTAMARAYRTGEPPADPAYEAAVRSMIVRRSRLLRRQVTYGPWTIALLGLADVVSVVSDRVTTGVPSVVFFGALMVYMRLSAPRALRRLERLEASLREPAAAGRVARRPGTHL
ncbi:hypothetical protein [Actinomadura sp. DC4]|uniref:hypothetical protein n=1 Tax=Actinomadura sp. DC4 TaxID=3055069 RepID=UPI0025B0455C|nr:hypothetical protein [Actinomadura sp. DC4]MDN3351754.1 hypothetical protein [Actinomadura sp. DC4]